MRRLSHTNSVFSCLANQSLCTGLPKWFHFGTKSGGKNPPFVQKPPPCSFCLAMLTLLTACRTTNLGNGSQNHYSWSNGSWNDYILLLKLIITTAPCQSCLKYMSRNSCSKNLPLLPVMIKHICPQIPVQYGQLDASTFQGGGPSSKFI